MFFPNRALKDCLCVTENLGVLILQDIPLREKDLTCLSKVRLSATTTAGTLLPICETNSVYFSTKQHLL